MPPHRQGTRWDLILQTLVSYRLISPGSQGCLHRDWFEKFALADRLGGDFDWAELHKLYECLDQLLAHKPALFDHLISTYFESDPRFPKGTSASLAAAGTNALMACRWSSP